VQALEVLISRLRNQAQEYFYSLWFEPLHGNIPEEHARVIGAVQHIDLTNGVQ
jgi:hypothetical protein